MINFQTKIQVIFAICNFFCHDNILFCLSHIMEQKKRREKHERGRFSVVERQLSVLKSKLFVCSSSFVDVDSSGYELMVARAYKCSKKINECLISDDKTIFIYCVYKKELSMNKKWKKSRNNLFESPKSP